MLKTNNKLFNLGIIHSPFFESQERFINKNVHKEIEVKFYEPIFNLSNRSLNEIEKRVLRKVLQFGLNNKKFDTNEILTRFLTKISRLKF